MNPEPEFLNLEDVLQIHDEHLAAYGGATGIRDQGLLESAVAMPQASFGGAYLHEDLPHMAAAYAFHIAQNQPFLDGNKRTGLVAALVFLDLNGITILDPQERLYDAMIALAERQMDKGGLAELLRELSAQGLCNIRNCLCVTTQRAVLIEQKTFISNPLLLSQF